ncbi:hypothetical protein [Nautilia sp.]
MRFFFFLLTVLLFSGCSSKINLAEYRPYYAPKNKNVSVSFKPSVKKVSIVKFPAYYFKGMELSETATYTLNSMLQTSKFVKILRIIGKEKIKEEIKAAEIAKETESDIGADYLLEGKILNATYTSRYHRGFYYYIKTPHGKIRKYSPPYYSYSSCTEINVKILKLPSLQNEYDRNFRKCAYFSDNVSYSKFYPNLVTESLKKTVKEAFESLKKFFAPKGYIYEVRKNGDDLIAKITLGKNQGMYEGLKLKIYRLRKDPVTGDIEKYSIGEGKVSNLIFENTCWITVDLKENRHIEIGDMVIPDFNNSFWDLF